MSETLLGMAIARRLPRATTQSKSAALEKCASLHYCVATYIKEARNLLHFSYALSVCQLLD